MKRRTLMSVEFLDVGNYPHITFTGDRAVLMGDQTAS
jgi:polyisoprenoid-binding protein YceI